jgi:hypothetical protein
VTPAPPETAGRDNRPDIFEEVLGLSDVSGDAGVIGTSLLLALLLLLIVLLDASIFNTTVEENAAFFRPFAAAVQAPLKTVLAAIGDEGGLMSSSLLRAGALLGLSALIYSFTDADAGINNTTIVLFASFLLAVAVATYVYDGLQVVVAERVFQLPSAIHLFPLGLVIAVGCVVISRFSGLEPGVFYGFVAAAVLLGNREPSRDEDGKIVLYPMLVMLGVSLVAWLLIDPFRSMSEDGSLAGAVLEGVAVATFLGGIQGSMFALLPIEFMDGMKVWRWRPLAWGAVALPVAFIFIHVLLKQGDTLDSATDAPGVRALFLIAVVFWVVTALTWGFFKLRRMREA